MTNPLKKQFSVEIEGVSYPLSFTRFDFARAQADTGLPFIPYGDGYIWHPETEAEGLLALVGFLYVGMKRAFPALTVDWLDEHVTPANAEAIGEALRPALEDFSLRLLENLKQTGTKAQKDSAPEITSTGSAHGTPSTSELVTPTSGN